MTEEYTPDRKLNKSIKSLGFLLHAKEKDTHLKLHIAFIALDMKRLIKGGSVRVYVTGNVYGSAKPKRFNRSPICFRILSVCIPYSDLSEANIHNRISLVFKDPEGNGFVKPVAYSLFKGFRGRGKSRALKTLDESDTSVYVRQSVRNRTYITQRRRNASDSKKLSRKITLAYYISLLMRWRKIVLLFEKESLKYEESASVLYERLIDQGHKNVFFVLDSSSPHWEYVKEKYTTNILPKHSFKHYLYFFISNTFLGTEMPAHAIDLRVANKHAVRKINSKKLRYVFLQHGVMYMISLASDARKPARKGEGGAPPLSKTVVSSQLEAQHFIDHGGYSEKDLYISGLPKFDRSKRLKDADKIVIMPTWRPWEYNQVRINPESTRYYKMLEDMIAGIPAKHKDKIHLLPHPLFIRELEDSPLSQYIKPFTSYDEVLQQAEILVTDYSSIAYDAFYRGTKVIFWWKDKDYCMDQYGGFLMLDENNTFGDIANNRTQLKQAVNSNYNKTRQRKYINRFKKIVEFNDSKNTERLIEMLVRDRIIDTKD